MKPTGVFIAVVGQSGVGKDSLLRYVSDALADDDRFLFPRRVITRKADIDSEDHDTLSVAEFEAAEAEGAFALSWRAHDLCYGLRRNVDDAVADGKVVIANLSRLVLKTAEQRYRSFLVVIIEAEPDVIAKRLLARRREPADMIASRLERRVPDHGIRPILIDNSGVLEDAGETFLAVLRDTANHIGAKA